MNLKTNLVLLLGVIIGVSLCQIFKSCSGGSEPVIHYPIEKTADTKKELQKKEQHFLAKEDSLKKQGDGLKKELTQTKQSLQQLKETNRFLKTQLLDLLDRQMQSDSFSSNTDTLTDKLNQFIDNSTQKDSCYESAGSNLEAQLNNKDSLITLEQEKYVELKTALDKTLTEKDFLIEENSQLQKQFKRQKAKRRFLSALVLIASGAAAGILLRH